MHEEKLDRRVLVRARGEGGMSHVVGWSVQIEGLLGKAVGWGKGKRHGRDVDKCVRGGDRKRYLRWNER